MTSPILKAVIDDIAAHGLQFEMRGAVALIRLARPQKRNALNDGIVKALRDIFTHMPEEARVAGLVY